MRKMISFKIENLPEKQRKVVDDWANGQANIQQSLANLIEHVVEFTGNADVMDFEIQRKLHTVLNNAQLAQTKIVTAAEPLVEVKAEPVQKPVPSDTDDPIAKATTMFDED